MPVLDDAKEATIKSLVGIWNGSQFPTQETTVILFPDGKGLHFFYYGSDGETPYVDEFTWEATEPGSLAILWSVHHAYDWYGDDEEDEAEVEGKPTEDPPLKVLSGTTSKVSYTIKTSGEGPVLTIALDENNDLNPMLNRVGMPGDFEAEREGLMVLADNFDPFGPDRNAWIIRDGRYLKASALPKLQKEVPPAQARFENRVDPTRWLVIPGCVGFFCSMPWNRVPSLIVIALAFLFSFTPCLILTRPRNFRMHGGASGMYLMFSLLYYASISKGTAGRLLPLWLLLFALGLIPVVRIVWEWILCEVEDFLAPWRSP